MRAWVALLLVPFAGCFGDDACVGASVVPLPDGFSPNNSNAEVQVPVFLSAPAPAQDLWSQSDGVLLTDVLQVSEQWIGAPTATGGEAGTVQLHQRACDAIASWDLPPPTYGVSAGASPGQGVHVYTAGFWTNGTMFYTNIQTVHDSDWPRAGWYEWGGADALPVYVYDDQASERTPVWGASATPPAPLGPVTGPVATPWQYFVTIPGFNEALKGLAPEGLRTVLLEPEEAYTRPGAEDHPLYGDALVFVVKVVEVRDTPCLDIGADGICRDAA